MMVPVDCRFARCMQEKNYRDHAFFAEPQSLILAIELRARHSAERNVFICATRRGWTSRRYFVSRVRAPLRTCAPSREPIRRDADPLDQTSWDNRPLHSED